MQCNLIFNDGTCQFNIDSVSISSEEYSDNRYFDAKLVYPHASETRHYSISETMLILNKPYPIFDELWDILDNRDEEGLVMWKLRNLI